MKTEQIYTALEVCKGKPVGEILRIMTMWGEDSVADLAKFFNCDNTAAAIAAARAEFKFTSFDPDNLPTPDAFAGRGYNGVVRIKGCRDLASDSWGPAEDGDCFFRAVLTLE